MPYLEIHVTQGWQIYQTWHTICCPLPISMCPIKGQILRSHKIQYMMCNFGVNVFIKIVYFFSIYGRYLSILIWCRKIQGFIPTKKQKDSCVWMVERTHIGELLIDFYFVKRFEQRNITLFLILTATRTHIYKQSGVAHMISMGVALAPWNIRGHELWGFAIEGSYFPQHWQYSPGNKGSQYLQILDFRETSQTISFKIIV